MTEPDGGSRDNAGPAGTAPVKQGASPPASISSPNPADRVVEAWSGAAVINASLIAFSVLVLLIAGLLAAKAYRSATPDDAVTALDFLAYVLPCFAGLAAGYAIYEKTVERPLFALSFQLLTAGVVIYSTAHVPCGPLIGTLLCGFLILPLVLLIKETRNAQWNGRPLAKVVVWLIISILVLISAVYVARLLEVGSR